MDESMWLAIGLVLVFGAFVRLLAWSAEGDPEQIAGAPLPRSFRAWFWQEFGELADGRRVRSLGVSSDPGSIAVEASGLGESWVLEVEGGELVFLEIRGRRCARGRKR